MSEAVRIIWQEHANISRVLECLGAVMSDPENAPDPDLLSAILDYMEGFADTIHHPKEEHYLLPALIRCRPEIAPLIQQVQDEHDRLLGMLSDLRRRLEAYRAGPAELDGLRDTVEAYVEFQLTHMAREDRGLLPVALESLSDEDWRVIDDAVARSDDPLFGADRQAKYDALYLAIMAASPVPII